MPKLQSRKREMFASMAPLDRALRWPGTATRRGRATTLRSWRTFRRSPREELMDQFSDRSGIAEYLQRNLSYILGVSEGIGPGLAEAGRGKRSRV